jgi:hypothetical protein
MAEPKVERVKKIADAVLHEGYLLYPYRTSALKNRQRWFFGRLYPRTCCEAQGGADAWFMQAECLLLGHSESRLGVWVRFFQLIQAQEPVEREVVVADVPLGELLFDSKSVPFTFTPIEGAVELSAGCASGNCFKLTVRILNHTSLNGANRDCADAVLPHTLLSAHAILIVRQGQFISLLDPPEPVRVCAAECRNVATWPVLVGDEGERDMMLAAPIILYDYPQVAPESPGDLFDGTEVDELLTLRVLTLTEEEKREVRSTDGRALALLDRTESLTRQQMLRLHGAVRGASPRFRPGTRVRLRPRGRSDAMDLVLTGKIATVVAVERDLEDRLFLAVTVDDDPGQDFGAEGRPGHRFFFRPEEVEPLMEDL